MAATALLLSCGQAAEQAPPASRAYTVDSLLNVAEACVGDTLSVRGVVRHTCRDSGLRCFIADKDGQTKLRINAPDGGSFQPDLAGREVVCRVIVRENRVMAHEVDSALAAIGLREAAEDSRADHCESSRNDLSAKKAYMELKGQDYYSEFYADALDFGVVGE